MPTRSKIKTLTANGLSLVNALDREKLQERRKMEIEAQDQNLHSKDPDQNKLDHQTNSKEDQTSFSKIEGEQIPRLKP